MGITGIICEFNPLHNGHQLLIQKAKALFPNNEIALIMSGNVVQRGELSCFDKAVRANWAIKAGADIVFELPAVFSNSYAMQFARGGIRLLSKLNAVTDLVFGSECGDVEFIKDFVEIYDHSNSKLRTNLQTFLDYGFSYPKALDSAVNHLKIDFPNSDETTQFLLPNNILGMEYIRAIDLFKSKIVPHTIQREKDEDTFMSASEIRQSLLQLDEQSTDPSEPFSQLKPFVPDFVYEDLLCRTFQDEANNNLFKLLKNKILTSQTPLSTISEVTEGIENRFTKGLEIANSYEEYIHHIKTKRYTMAKIKRILISILLDKTKSLDALSYENIDYIKVLAVKATKKSLLSIDSELKLITKTSDLANLNADSAEFLRIDKMADDLFNICNDETVSKIYTHKMLVVD